MSGFNPGKKHDKLLARLGQPPSKRVEFRVSQYIHMKMKQRAEELDTTLGGYAKSFVYADLLRWMKDLTRRQPGVSDWKHRKTQRLQREAVKKLLNAMPGTKEEKVLFYRGTLFTESAEVAEKYPEVTYIKKNRKWAIDRDEDKE